MRVKVTTENGRPALMPWALQRIGGLVPSNAADATNDLTLSPGWIVNSAETLAARLAQAMTKRADAAWAQGTGNGGMFSGLTWAANDWHLIVIRQDSDGAVDFGFDTSVTGANKPSGWTVIGRAASVRTTGASWRLFTAVETAGGGLDIEYKVVVAELTDYTGSSARQTLALGVPAGIQVMARLTGTLVIVSTSNLERYAWIKSVDFTDVTPAMTGHTLVVRTEANGDGACSSLHLILTNTSRQVAHRMNDNTTCRLSVNTHGFIDARIQ